VLAAVAVGFKICWNDHRIAEHKADVAAPVPSELITTSPAALPTGSSPTGSSAAGSTHLLVKAIVPSHLFIPAIGVNTTVAAKPSNRQWDEFLGKNVTSFSVPSDMYTTTWWSADANGTPAPRPGSDGMAVILGHTQIGAYGVFNRLGQLRPTDVAAVSNATATLKFTVLSVTRGIPKSDGAALGRVLDNHPQAARLALITCSGHFNGRESAQNTVVFLRLAGM
jgi:LPXTG-site transpeptidase (sortase) family protein